MGLSIYVMKEGRKQRKKKIGRKEMVLKNNKMLL